MRKHLWPHILLCKIQSALCHTLCAEHLIDCIHENRKNGKLGMCFVFALSRVFWADEVQPNVPPTMEAITIPRITQHIIIIIFFYIVIQKGGEKNIQGSKWEAEKSMLAISFQLTSTVSLLFRIKCSLEQKQITESCLVIMRLWHSLMMLLECDCV